MPKNANTAATAFNDLNFELFDSCFPLKNSNLRKCP